MPSAIMDVHYEDRIVSLAIQFFHLRWENGRLLAGGPILGTQGFCEFKLDMRYWKVTEENTDGWNHALCKPREKKAVQLVIKDGDRAISWEAFGYVKFKKEEQDAYGVFLNDGNTELVSTTDHEVYIQTVQDHSQGRAVEAIIAVKKEEK